MDSTEEEKGSDCLESFRGMQQCFSENPEHYKVPGERETEIRKKARENRESESVCRIKDLCHVTFTTECWEQGVGGAAGPRAHTRAHTHARTRARIDLLHMGAFVPSHIAEHVNTRTHLTHAQTRTNTHKHRSSWMGPMRRRRNQSQKKTRDKQP